MLRPNLRRRPVVIIVRDGWGANPYPQWNHANAVVLARTPVDDRLMAAYPHELIKTSGYDVGLPEGVMGNSEVGHQNIGAGRVVEQEIMRITGRIGDGTFFENAALRGAFERATRTQGSVHILGLCSDGRVHSDLEHLYALLEMSVRLKFPGRRVFVHAITDGRDTLPQAGLGFVRAVEQKCRALGINPVASVCGRYYAMDRDNRWDRVQRAYAMLVGGRQSPGGGPPGFDGAEAAIAHYYENPTAPSMHGDEFIVPSITSGAESAAEPRPPGSASSRSRIKDGDSVIFFNFRGDRPRELVRAFVNEVFPYDGHSKDGRPTMMGFERGPRLDLQFVTLTAYEQGLPVQVAFNKSAKMSDILGDFLSRLGLAQFRCAETEKYPHVTFFFNDYRDEPFPGEDRKLVNSPRDVATYDLKPEMSAYEVTDAMLEAIASQRYDAMILNYANGDMVGHTGNLQAAIRAVETVDECVGRVVEAVLKLGGALIVTADHGNCEQMIDPESGGPHTAHTTYPVELMVVDDELKGRRLRPNGRLADIAPTALALMGLPQPEDMTGRSLLDHGT